MPTLRWAAILLTAVCTWTAIYMRVFNGVALLALIFAGIAAWTVPAIRDWLARLTDPLPGVCLDCRDGRHRACPGDCACPVDHTLELSPTDLT